VFADKEAIFVLPELVIIFGSFAKPDNNRCTGLAGNGMVECILRHNKGHPHALAVTSNIENSARGNIANEKVAFRKIVGHDNSRERSSIKYRPPLCGLLLFSVVQRHDVQ
jgi:hypothetical protein